MFPQLGDDATVLGEFSALLLLDPVFKSRCQPVVRVSKMVEVSKRGSKVWFTQGRATISFQKQV